MKLVTIFLGPFDLCWKVYVMYHTYFILRLHLLSWGAHATDWCLSAGPHVNFQFITQSYHCIIQITCPLSLYYN
jgi:hypothetical protein